MAEEEKISLTVTTPTGTTTDLGQMWKQIVWAGDRTQAARTLDVDILATPYDKNVPTVDCPVGSIIQFDRNGENLFIGTVLERLKDSAASVLTLSCTDGGYYVVNNEGVFQFENQTAEAATAAVCSQYGIETGELASTGIQLTRNFIGVSLYKIIMTMYTLAGEQNGKRYMVRFNGQKLEVIEKKQDEQTILLKPGSNLLSASVNEQLPTTTQVEVYDENDQLVTTIRNDEAISEYNLGTLSSYLKEQKDKDSEAEAEGVLEDNDATETIKLEAFGSPKCKAGSCVCVYEEYTGLYGLFWIESDTHTWKNGLYQMKLSVSYENLMDEQDAGSLPDE